MKYLTTILVLIALVISTSAQARDPHFQDPGIVTTNTTEVTNNITSADGNYGLMAMASTGLVFDCCRPNTLQWAVAGSFSEGGNQAFSAGLANNFGPVLVNVRFTTVIDSPDKENDYALVVGGAGAFK